ncbi:MAG: response regulator, partial [Alkalispirochaetaceae bacterium]
MIKELSVGSATVLILEDEPIARLHLAQLLRRRTDLHIEALGSGEKAVAFAEQSKIDVLLADIVMEGIDGIEAAARIQARQDTVVIFVTASTDPKTRERAQKLKPYAIMTKPTEIEELIALVDGALSARQSPEEAYLQPDFLLDTLYDTAAIGMCVTDTEGRFVRVNRAYCNTYGYSREEILGEPFTMVLPEE